MHRYAAAGIRWEQVVVPIARQWPGRDRWLLSSDRLQPGGKQVVGIHFLYFANVETDGHSGRHGGDQVRGACRPDTVNRVEWY